MDNMLSYLRWAGGQDMLSLPFNELDGICLSQVVHLPLEKAFQWREQLSLKEAAVALKDIDASKIYEHLLRQRLGTLQLMGESARFGALRLSRFEEEISLEDESQFCAVTLTLEDGTPVICFRGTDLSLVGWKEDFNMSYASPVPAQQSAIDYLERVAGSTAAPIVMLGHSKGGNLAVYAAAFSGPKAQDRLRAVYTFDGPGLSEEDARSAGYLAVRDRIRSYLPQNSVVGILLHQHKPYEVVRSKAISLFQHDAYSWEVEEGAAAFVREAALTRHSQLLDSVLDKWLHDLSLDDRRTFCDAIYEVFTAGDDQTLGELVRLDYHKAMSIFKAMQGVPPVVGKAVRQAIKLLLQGTVESVVEVARQAVSELLPGPAEPEVPPPDPMAEAIKAVQEQQAAAPSGSLPAPPV